MQSIDNEDNVDNNDKKLTYFILLIMLLSFINSYLGNLQSERYIVQLCIDLLSYILFLSIIIDQKGKLEELNITGFSTILLVLSQSLKIVLDFPIRIKIIFILTSMIISIIFVVLYFNKKTAHKTINYSIQISSFIVGLFIGLCLSAIKLLFIQPQTLSLAINNPLPFFYSLLVTLPLGVVNEEFVFRGVLWGWLSKKHLTSRKILFISSFVWAMSHFRYFTNWSVILDIFIHGYIFGFLVKKFKTIDSSIGAHIGYNSLVLFAELLVIQ